MQVVVHKNYHEMSADASAIVLSEIMRNPALLLATATGATPTATYAGVARLRRERDLSFDSVRVIKLDEWLGVPMDDPASCERYLRDHVLGPWGIPATNYRAFSSCPTDAAAECASVRDWLKRQGPIDLAVLGLGVNGHIGFNEPADSLVLDPHTVALSAASRAHDMVAGRGLVVETGITLGIGDVMSARKLLLLVSGASKAPPLARVFSGEVSTHIPASLLNLHPNAFCLCDRAAASLIAK